MGGLSRSGFDEWAEAGGAGAEGTGKWGWALGPGEAQQKKSTHNRRERPRPVAFSSSRSRSPFHSPQPGRCRAGRAAGSRAGAVLKEEGAKYRCTHSQGGLPQARLSGCRRRDEEWGGQAPWKGGTGRAESGERPQEQR